MPCLYDFILDRFNSLVRSYLFLRLDVLIRWDDLMWDWLWIARSAFLIGRTSWPSISFGPGLIPWRVFSLKWLLLSKEIVYWSSGTFRIYGISSGLSIFALDLYCLIIYGLRLIPRKPFLSYPHRVIPVFSSAKREMDSFVYLSLYIYSLSLIFLTF